MKRKDFLLGIGALPAAFFLKELPNIGNPEEKFTIWGTGYRGRDYSLRLGFMNEADEQFFLGYRKATPNYKTWKKHFKKPTKKWQPKNYKEAARADDMIFRLSREMRDNFKRFKSNPYNEKIEDKFYDWIRQRDMTEYHDRMAIWCKRLIRVLEEHAGR